MEFIYFIRPHKENFAETMSEEEGEIMGVHFEYLSGLLESGKLILAGPETSGKFGIVIIEAESESDAREIMMNDPAVKSGIVSCELYPYRVSLMKAK
ncbi:MAG: hypothetical protein IAE90_02470 [Ignavibacteria bacterium]|nr:hypothetical protein [Ignavibacteria bacterium]